MNTYYVRGQCCTVKAFLDSKISHTIAITQLTQCSGLATTLELLSKKMTHFHTAIKKTHSKREPVIRNKNQTTKRSVRPMRGNSEDTVYQKIKNAIRKRYIKQGSQLVEGSLAQKLGVSRTPVRSAIKRLESEGLVNSIPNRGAFVITPTLKEIEETFLVRSQLEQMAAGLTARSITPEQIDQLNHLIQQEEKVFHKRDLDEYYVVNDTFHLKIAEFSSNTVLTSYVRELLDRTRIFLILFDPFIKLSISPSLLAHQEIVNALANHDAKAAATAVARHIRCSVEDLETADVVPDDYLSI